MERQPCGRCRELRWCGQGCGLSAVVPLVSARKLPPDRVSCASLVRRAWGAVLADLERACRLETPAHWCGMQGLNLPRGEIRPSRHLVPRIGEGQGALPLDTPRIWCARSAARHTLAVARRSVFCRLLSAADRNEHERIPALVRPGRVELPRRDPAGNPAPTHWRPRIGGRRPPPVVSLG